jgi:hypothetical protein
MASDRTLKMTPELRQRIKPLCEAAIEMPGEDRARFIRDSCKDDPEAGSRMWNEIGSCRHLLRRVHSIFSTSAGAPLPQCEESPTAHAKGYSGKLDLSLWHLR